MTIDQYSPPDNLSILIKSPDGSQIQRISNSDESGPSLECEIEWLKNGGVNNITFMLNRDNSAPLAKGSVIEVYHKGVLQDIGYLNNVPLPEGDEESLEIQCFGYQHKLFGILINKTYASKTLVEILEDNEAQFVQAEILFDVSKLDLPNITVSNLKMEDKDLHYLVRTVLQIANEDFQNAQYRWFIDKERTLNFELISNDPITSLFEGYHYQNPQPEIDDQDVVNQVYLYRANQTNSKEMEFVGVYDDLPSQDQNGIRNKKITIPDFIDNTAAARIANGILADKKDPKEKTAVEGIVDNVLDFGFYNIGGRFEKLWKLITECDSLDGWDLSNAPNTAVALSSEEVLTGRRSIKCETGNGSVNEYIEYTIDPRVFGMEVFRMFVFLRASMVMEISVIDSNDNFYTYSFGQEELDFIVNTTLIDEEPLFVTLFIEGGGGSYGEALYGGGSYGES